MNMKTFFTNSVIFILLFPLSSFSQQKSGEQSSNIFQGATISIDKYSNTPVEIRFNENKMVSPSSFFKEYKNTFKISEDIIFKLFRTFTDQIGQTHFRYKQYYKNIEVTEIQYLLHERNGTIFYAHGKAVHDLNLSISPSLTEAEALKVALYHINADEYMWENNQSKRSAIKDQFLKDISSYPRGELKISAPINKIHTEKWMLVYRFDIFTKKPFGRYCVDVDAHRGEIVKVLPKMYTGDVSGEGLSLYNGMVPIIIDSMEGKYRLRESSRGGGIITYDALNQTDLESSIDFIAEDSIFTEQNARAGVSVHWATEATYDYYLEKHGRNSYDDMGGKLISYAHFGYEVSNAYYFGGGHMVYGDGRGNVGPWVTVDWVGHEITHGVSSTSAGLGGNIESGALRESFSDIFATAIEFYVEGALGDWLIGEDNFLGEVRSLQNPKDREDPDTYMGRFWMNDYESPHENGGVQNHWFYLLSEGGSGVNDNGYSYDVTGIGIENAAQIAYRNLTAYLMPTSEYYDARLGSINSVIDLFGRDSQQYKAVLDAWDAVGVYIPFVGPFAKNGMVNNTYQIPGADTLILKTELVNPENHTIDVQAVIESLDLSITDTIAMHDDGMHHDDKAGDGLWGESWPVPSGERHYKAYISIFSSDSDHYNVLQDAAHFTTIGPVVFDSYTVTSEFENIVVLKLSVTNMGQDSTANDITVELTATDTAHVASIVTPSYIPINIPPGETVLTYQYFGVETKGSATEIPLQVNISSNDYHFWTDSFTISLIDAIEKLDSNIPIEFTLHQNYPNPFNPKTTINYELPARSAGGPITNYVELSIYNLLGQKVSTLVNGRQNAGHHQVEWDASSFASGVYYYQLRTDAGFIQTKKLVLLR
jgi:Zn-dependent metalloprotease